MTRPELVVTVVEATGPVEIARHARGQRGRPQIRDEHYPPEHPTRTGAAGERPPRAGNAAEAAFLALGDGAAAWLVEAAAAGTTRVRAKMADAVTLGKLHGTSAVDQALGVAALAGRFAEDDLSAILDHQQTGSDNEPVRASETHSLQPGTRGWASLGARTTDGGGVL